MSRDDVVLQRPEDIRFVVPVFHTAGACPGSVTAYLLRRIAYRAGAYAPGIQELIFHELNTSGQGGTIERVQRWFAARASMLQQLAYRVQCRRVATDTQVLIDWVKAGRGYRGVMLLTDFKTLHPEPDAAGDVRPEQVQHAVGVTVDRLDTAGDESLVMIDPYPGAAGAKDRGTVHPKIEEAHRGRNFHGLIYYWSGWS